MKIGVLSDIHVDINYAKGDFVTPALLGEINKRELDAVIIAGDISGDYIISASVIQTLRRETEALCLFVPGNHDIWNEFHPRLDAWTIYNRLMEIEGNLSAGYVDLDDTWTVIGDLGWYDYSFGDGSFSSAELSTMQYGGREWQDHIYAKWDRSPEDMHRYFYEKLEGQLKELAGRKVIMVTHMLPIDDFTVKEDHNQAELWKYFNAFLGSRDYGVLAERTADIRLSISGHVHYRKHSTRNETLFLCNCLGYRTDWEKTDDPYKEIPGALYTVNTDDLLP